MFTSQDLLANWSRLEIRPAASSMTPTASPPHHHGVKTHRSVSSPAKCSLTGASLTSCDEGFVFEPNWLNSFVSILITWLGALFGGELVKNSAALQAFSISKNFKELTQSKPSKFAAIDYIRVFAIIWVMVNHTASEGRIDILERLPSAQIFKDNIHNHPFFGPVFGNSALGVEVFLVLSGFLAARTWARFATTNASQTFGRNYSNFIIRRILRLFPSVAVFVYLAQSQFTQTYLPRFYDSMISTCGWRGFAAHLTFTSNWQSAPTCLGYLWYLGLDFQLYALAPLLMGALVYNPKLGAGLVTGLIAASCLARAFVCRFYDICNKSDVDIPFISFPNQTQSELDTIYRGLWDIYSRPYTKCGPFFIGILAGFVSVHFVKAPAFSAKTLRAMNYAAVGVMAFCIFGILPEYWYPDAGNTAYNTFYTAVFRTLFGAATAWFIVYAMYWHQVKFSLMMNILATITFQAYLIHMPVVYLFNHLPFLQTAHGPWEVFAVLPAVAVISYALALVLYLIVEAPLSKLANQLYSHVFASSQNNPKKDA